MVALASAFDEVERTPLEAAGVRERLGGGHSGEQAAKRTCCGLVLGAFMAVNSLTL
jgi:hypothetical protein